MLIYRLIGFSAKIIISLLPYPFSYLLLLVLMSAVLWMVVDSSRFPARVASEPVIPEEVMIKTLQFKWKIILIENITDRSRFSIRIAASFPNPHHQFRRST